MSVENKKTYLKGVSDKKNTCKIQVESEKKKEKRKKKKRMLTTLRFYYCIGIFKTVLNPWPV